MTLVGAFTTEEVARLSGLSKRQIAYWDRTGLYEPGLAKGRSRQPYGRIYSFRDAVALRTLAKLRKRIPLQQIRRVSSWLHQHYDTPFARLSFYVVGRRVFFRDPQSAGYIATDPPGQKVIPFYLEEVSNEVEELISALGKRHPRDIGKVTRHRFVAQNRHVIAGTRIPTEIVWDYYTAGFEIQAIQEAYPELTTEDIRAAIDFEAQQLAS